MVEFDSILVGSPPRAGGGWVLEAALVLGIKPIGHRTLYAFPKSDDTKFRIGIVRHPYSWLQSFYFKCRGKFVGIPEIDTLSQAAQKCPNFNKFVELYVNTMPGSVTKLFDAYQSHSVLRVEDFPWSVVELFGSILHKESSLTPYECDLVLSIPKSNIHPTAMPVDPRLCDLVMQAESDFCERYEYV